MTGLTRYEWRVLRAVRRGVSAHRDRDRPQFIVFAPPGVKTFRTAEYMIRRLQNRRLIAPSDNMLALELTHEGIASLGGSPHEGKPTMPPGLLRFARTKAMARVHEMRMEGFADPVDMLLAIACETNEEGEWAHPMDVRLQALAGAAPYCRPKLQAIIAKLHGDSKSHAEWLKELKGEIYGDGSGIIEGKVKPQ